MLEDLNTMVLSIADQNAIIPFNPIFLPNVIQSKNYLDVRRLEYDGSLYR